MRILNRTRKTILAENIELARSFWKKSMGLMFRSNIDEDAGFLMEFGKENKDLYSIWMLGMFFPIDIIFINSRKEVTDIYENARPVSLDPRTWKVYRPTKPVKWILEVAAGKAKKSGTSVGDRLDF